MTLQKPSVKPNDPNFSCGPCAKRPGWSFDNLKDAALGRSHRSKLGKAKLKEVIDRHREILGIPSDYRIAIVPASDTGAVEMAMWSMLGGRGVDVFAWENFSNDWLIDVRDHLKIEDLRIFCPEYGVLPDMTAYDGSRDAVFPWNGTTSGVVLPNADWIPDHREGITICDATSAAFAYDLPWTKLDVITWSWQKILGSEAAHGMLVLSPRAVERLESYTPSWPLPKIFRMVKKGKIDDGLFEGVTINTPSMMAVEDCLDSLRWIESIGGLNETIARTKRNFQVMKNWVDRTDWIDFLAKDPATFSRTSLCFTMKTPDGHAPEAFAKKIVSLLDAEDVAKDINAYRTAPAGLRIWCGTTVETSDLEALTPWLEWAYHQAQAA